jgi:regulator of protease activity HflC (stomatin/prohibitin superfamily)
VNPYEVRIDLVDCRSQRFNLSSDGEMGFPSRDGFWITLDGIIEFRVMPEEAARVFVTYNDVRNDEPGRARIDEEIVKMVILPNARSFCRLRGSDHSGREFISGTTRMQFQEDFQQELERTCESQGIEIVQALLTRIHPPQQIAEPVRTRQIAVQKKEQYLKQIEQQESQKQLAIQQETVKQKQALIGGEQTVVKVTTEARREQEVALIQANQQLNVAGFELAAAKDMAAATLARGTADAEVIHFENEAEAAGWRKSVEAFSGDGNAFARWVLLQKIAPAFRRMMVNTADSPLMDIFRQYDVGGSTATRPASVPAAAEAGGDR